jgi:hypothetical protein
MSTMTMHNKSARQAVAQAFAAFAKRHPDYAASLFDESFLQRRVAPLLSAPGGATILTPEWLAGAWAAQFAGRGLSILAGALPVAADFIDLLKRALASTTAQLPALKPAEVA